MNCGIGSNRNNGKLCTGGLFCNEMFLARLSFHLFFDVLNGHILDLQGKKLAYFLADIKDLADSYKDSDIDVSPIGIRVTKQWVNAADDEHAKYL